MSITSFKFYETSLFTVTIDDKVWTRAYEVSDVLDYKKGRTRDALKRHVNTENKRHRYELEGCVAAARPFGWPKNSQPDEYYINEEGMYELLFKSQQPKAKEFRSYCCNELFPKIRNQLLHQKIEEKDGQLALLNDDLTNAEQNVVALEQDNLELQALVAQRSVPYLDNETRNNGIVVIQKNNGDSYPYIAICGQQGYVAQKIQNKLTDYPNGPNAIVYYNWLRERGCIVANPARVRHFKLGENYTHQRLIELQDA